MPPISALAQLTGAIKSYWKLPNFIRKKCEEQLVRKLAHRVNNRLTWAIYNGIISDVDYYYWRKQLWIAEEEQNRKCLYNLRLSIYSILYSQWPAICSGLPSRCAGTPAPEFLGGSWMKREGFTEYSLRTCFK